MTLETKMNIFQRINEVRKKVDLIIKDKEVAGKYKAVTHDAVTGAIRLHLIEHGIIVLPNLIKAQTVTTPMVTGKGIPIIRYEALFNIGFVNCEEPADRVDVAIEAHALDEGDKAPGKAVSYATKYAMLKLFSIETGEEDEKRYEDARRDRKITPAAGTFESLDMDTQTYVTDCAMEIATAFHREGIKSAFALYEEHKAKVADWDNAIEVRAAMWSKLDSKLRSAIKAYGKGNGNAIRDAAEQRSPVPQ